MSDMDLPKNQQYPAGGREQRVTQIMLAYWNIARGERKFPTREEIKPEDITDEWPDCFIVEVTGDDEKPEQRYVYVGERINVMFGDDMTGAKIMTLDPKLAEKYQEVTKTASPLLDDNSFVNLRNATIKYRQILLPLGNQDGKVQYILGAMRYKVFENEDS